MTEDRVLTLADLSDGEVELLKLNPEAKFSTDGKTVALPPDPDEPKAGATVAQAREVMQRNFDIPKPPEHIAKKLAEGFAPPSSMVVTEDGKVVKQEGAAPEKAKDIVASEAELADYLRCLLAGRPFTKVYEFMDGHVKVTMRERSSDEEEDIIRRSAITASAEGQINNPVMLTMLVTKYRLAYTIERIVIGTEVRDFTRVPVGKLIEGATGVYEIDRRVADLGALPGVLFAVVGIAAAEFSGLVGDIAARAADPKSWRTPSAV